MSNEITQQQIDNYNRCAKVAQTMLIPKGYAGALFNAATGEAVTLAEVKPSALPDGVVFISALDFKSQGSESDYIAHLESVIESLSADLDGRSKTEAERLLLGVVQQLGMGNSIDRHCGWGKDVIAWARKGETE